MSPRSSKSFMTAESIRPSCKILYKKRNKTDMKILLTGGAGFIGSHTCVELCDAGHDPVIVDNYVNSSPESIRRIEKIVGRPVPHYEADVADKAAMDRIFSENDFDCVIHFAGLKAVGESVAKPLLYYRNNLDTTLTLCEVMQAHGVKKIVFSSSATVYGNQDTVPYREDMQSAGCTNPYGWTKYMIEKILEGQAVADPEWSIVLLRYFNPIGAHSSGLIGEDPSGIPNNLMPYVANDKRLQGRARHPRCNCSEDIRDPS